MLLLRVAERIRAMTVQDLPQLARDTAKDAILDTIGVTLAGASAEPTAAVARATLPYAGAGDALILGSARRVDPLSAALVNGTAAHALDFDDCSNTLGGHPSAPVVPALWALAETRGASGAAFLAAYAAGVECETKIGRAVNFHHYEKGWHPTATLGTFGSAAACAHLMGLPEDGIARALAIATSSAAGIKANFGTMTKPFHVGQSARAGLLAALLAEAGLTANPGALEDGQGFFAVFDENQVAAGRILAEWGAPLDLIDPGIAFKRHPCCASTHPAVDALLLLRERHGLRPDDVALIESWTHPRRFRHTNRPDPKSGLDGKFSVQYVLARALIAGLVSLDDFSEAAVRDPLTRSVMARLRAAADPDATMETTEHFYARLRLTMRDGTVHEASVDRPLGRDREHPLPQGVLEAKFRDCAGQALSPAKAEALLDGLRSLEEVPRIAALSALMERAPAAPPAALRAI